MKRKFYIPWIGCGAFAVAHLLCSCGPKSAPMGTDGDNAANSSPAETKSAAAKPAEAAPKSNSAAEPTASISVSVKKPDVIKDGLTRYPYLQMATSKSIKILWRQQISKNPVLKYGTSASALSHTVPTEKMTVRQTKLDNPAIDPKLALHSAPTKTKQFEASIEGLEPDTKYFYAVEDGGKVLASGPEYYFKTPAPIGSDKPLTIWVAGDGGTGGRTQTQVQGAALSWVKKAGKELDMFLHVGDMAYNSGLDPEFQGRFFEMYGGTLRNTVCWPAMGNHEGKTSKGEFGVGPYYDAFECPQKGEAGGVPSGREAYYSFDQARVHFVVLDSCGEGMKKNGDLTSLGNEMMTWLKSDLEQAKADWLVAFFHHPPYTKGSHDSDIQKDYESAVMRKKYLPLLESAGVDLVLSGHSHIYERTMLLHGSYDTPSKAAGVVLDDGDGPYAKSAGLNAAEGAIYIVTGNAGTTLKRVGTIPFMKKIILEHGSVVLDVTGDKLKGTMVNKEGVASDTFEIYKHGKVAAREPLTSIKPPPPMPLIRTVKGEGLPVDKKEDENKAPSLKEKGLDMPAKYAEVIAPRSKWKYFVGPTPPDWNKATFDDATWPIGTSGFGYGDSDDQTDLQTKLKDLETNIFIRSEFELPAGADASKLGIGIRYDDGFIAYINGVEVARKNVDGEGESADCLKTHEADKLRFEYFPLKTHVNALKPGKNVISFQGVNESEDSSDMSLSPMLVLEK